MAQKERRPILRIPVTVEAHDTGEKAEKETLYKVTAVAPEGFYVGLKEAKAKLEIKALDDIILHNLPLEGEFVVEVYDKVVSEPVQKPKTEPTTLEEHETEADDKTEVDEAIKDLEPLESEEEESEET